MTLRDLLPTTRRRRKNVPAARTDATENPFVRLHEQMDRLFEDFLPDTFRALPWSGDAFAGDWDFMPDVDVRDGRKEVLVSVELPGVDEKDLDVRLDGSTLTIRGEKRQEKTETEDGLTHSECCYGSFVRSIPLGCRVDADGVKATFSKGVLKVKLPKAKGDADTCNRIPVTGA